MSFEDEVGRGIDGARNARAFKSGTVTAYNAGTGDITATIDGGSIEEIRRVSTYTTPANGDNALFAVVRGDTAVQYVAIGVIT